MPAIEKLSIANNRKSFAPDISIADLFLIHCLVFSYLSSGMSIPGIFQHINFFLLMKF
jgi:hypothetical protein